ncbi:GntR family transcriptional regulator [Aeoliella sp. ICT_H6.2]|uniref:GntR family transcriptional regulator n=1 Tax=Aeoliella straminimaris TaxID=2954799 RepID=A0A9X2JEZ4_9BACT|nr:GntR family transcriptional regulator [Aeoliella straminimaris]
MFIRVDSSNGVPVYEQIVRQVKFAIADGVVAAGDLLPSVRELARELAINPNTVARAYRDLQSQELVELASGIGLSVRGGAKRECQTQRRQLLQARVGQVLEEAFRSGLDAAAVRRLVDAELTRLEKQFMGNGNHE